jgi:hypothetical protein
MTPALLVRFGTHMVVEYEAGRSGWDALLSLDCLGAEEGADG